jgi:hypothetical protein
VETVINDYIKISFKLSVEGIYGQSSDFTKQRYLPKELARYVHSNFQKDSVVSGFAASNQNFLS